MKKLFAAAILAASTLAATAPAEASHKGWYVIMGSFNFTAMADARALASDIRNDCGLDPRVEDAINVSGLNPNVAFVYMGPYHSKARAQSVRRTARACVSDAYIKYGVPN